MVTVVSLALSPPGCLLIFFLPPSAGPDSTRPCFTNPGRMSQICKTSVRAYFPKSKPRSLPNRTLVPSLCHEHCLYPSTSSFLCWLPSILIRGGHRAELYTAPGQKDPVPPVTIGCMLILAFLDPTVFLGGVGSSHSI